MKRLRKELDDSVASGLHPAGCDTVRSIITHESGHGLSFDAIHAKGDFYKELLSVKLKYTRHMTRIRKKYGIMSDYGGNAQYFSNSFLQKEGVFHLKDPRIEKWKKAYRKEKKKIRISEYGEQDMHEFVAESFAMVTHGTSPSQYALDVVAILKKYKGKSS